MVVLPHGGPESRDWPVFDWWAQFLATRGYAVLQPQFRGSSGFGTAHREAGQRQWGGLMQDDVGDGVKHLIAAGVADPARIASPERVTAGTQRWPAPRSRRISKPAPSA